MTAVLRSAYRAGHQGRPGWRLALEYDADLVEALKTSIPHTDRAWDADAKEWWVAVVHEETLLRLMPSFEAYQKQLQLL